MTTKAVLASKTVRVAASNMAGEYLTVGMIALGIVLALLI